MQTRFGSQAERYRYARPTDMAAIAATLSIPAAAQWLWFMPASPSALAAHFMPRIDQQWQTLADGRPPEAAVLVVETAEGDFAGLGTVSAVQGSTAGFELGLLLAKPGAAADTGPRTAEFLATWAALLHRAYRLQAGCLEGDADSRAVFVELGMTLEGTRPDFRLKGDIRHTELQFGVRVADLDPELVPRTAQRLEFET